MSAEPKMQPDPLEQLRSALESESLSHDSLAEYVGALAQNKSENEVFLRLALRGRSAEAYGLLNPSDQAHLRQWWHDRLRREAYAYDDLRTRLSWRYLI